MTLKQCAQTCMYRSQMYFLCPQKPIQSENRQDGKAKEWNKKEIRVKAKHLSCVQLTTVCNNIEEACHHEPPLFPDIYILLHLENIMMQCINKHDTNKYYRFKILWWINPNMAKPHIDTEMTLTCTSHLVALFPNAWTDYFLAERRRRRPSTTLTGTLYLLAWPSLSSVIGSKVIKEYSALKQYSFTDNIISASETWIQMWVTFLPFI